MANSPKKPATPPPGVNYRDWIDPSNPLIDEYRADDDGDGIDLVDRELVAAGVISPSALINRYPRRSIQQVGQSFALPNMPMSAQARAAFLDCASAAHDMRTSGPTKPFGSPAPTSHWAHLPPIEQRRELNKAGYVTVDPPRQEPEPKFTKWNE